MRQVFLMVIIISTLSTGYAQVLKSDTLLYLYFDKGSSPAVTNISNGAQMLSFSNGVYFKIEHTSGFSKAENRIINPENLYSFHDYYLYRGYPIAFRSINKASSITIPCKKLKKINVVEIEELSVFLKSNYKERRPEEYLDSKEIYTEPTPPDPLGSISYWDRLKHIYMVEINKKEKTATITEVRFDIQIE
ncbi:MAG: hypothetical protein MUF39_04025 [Cyclobacteriaceae bacterium]|nr:hypothetical protein [Cyclobacteriaceae bacterium]